MNHCCQTSFPDSPCRESVSVWVREDLWATANAILRDHGRPELAPVEVSYDLRGRCAGQVAGSRIRLNLQLFELPAADYHALRDTACHEMAHLLAQQLRPRCRAHGQTWRWAAAALGATPNRTHQLPLRPARRSRWYQYDLPQAGRVEIGPLRHRRLQAGQYRSLIWKATGERVLPVHFSGEAMLRYA